MFHHFQWSFFSNETKQCNKLSASEKGLLARVFNFAVEATARNYHTLTTISPSSCTKIINITSRFSDRKSKTFFWDQLYDYLLPKVELSNRYSGLFTVDHVSRVSLARTLARRKHIYANCEAMLGACIQSAEFHSTLIACTLNSQHKMGSNIHLYVKLISQCPLRRWGTGISQYLNSYNDSHYILLPWEWQIP